MPASIILKPFHTESIAPGVSRDWSADRKLVIYTIDDLTRPTIVAWTESMQELGRSWPHGEPMRALHQMLTVHTLRMAPFIAAQLSDINAQPITASRIYTGFVMPNVVFASAVRVLAMSQSLAMKPRVPITIEAFSDRDQAIHWITCETD